MSVSHRSILGYLNDEYGVPRSAIKFINAGSSHTKLRFSYQGQRRTVMLPNSPSDPKWEIIKRGDIRRELGPPSSPSPTSSNNRNLEDMTTQLVPFGAALGAAPSVVPTSSTTLPSGPGKVSLRASNNTLAFNIPDDVRSHFVANGGETTHVEFQAPNAWTIRHGPGPRFWPRANGGLAIGGKPYLVAFGGYFKRCPTRCTMIADGSIIVKLTDRPIIENAPGKPTKAPIPVPTTTLPASPEPTILQPSSAPIYRSSSSEDDMRAALALVREIEALSPYRLTRIRHGDEDVLVWRAPTIE